VCFSSPWTKIFVSYFRFITFVSSNLPIEEERRRKKKKKRKKKKMMMIMMMMVMVMMMIRENCGYIDCPLISQNFL
jgi:hypothetical protein